MLFKLFFRVSVVNVFLVFLVIVFGLVKQWWGLDESTVTLFKLIIIGLALSALGVWSFLGCFLNCPHCGRQALLFNLDQKRVVVIKSEIPILLRPFSFLIDDEYFAGYCHCQSCNEKIDLN